MKQLNEVTTIRFSSVPIAIRELHFLASKGHADIVRNRSVMFNVSDADRAQPLGPFSAPFLDNAEKVWIIYDSEDEVVEP